MIDELTPEQEAKLTVYHDKFITQCMCCDPVDVEKAKEFAKDFYVKVLERPAPLKTIVEPSPYAAWRTTCAIALSEDQISANEVDRESEEYKECVKNYIAPYLNGSFDANIFGFYDFFLEVLNLQGVPENILTKYVIWRESINFGVIYPLEKVCVISDRPKVVRRNENGLHYEHGPAIEYRDGFSVYALNGVRVPRRGIEIAASQITEDIIRKICKGANDEYARYELAKRSGNAELIKLFKEEKERW